MLKTVTTHRAALLGGALALAAALPSTAVQADEPMRLDAAQLDGVTAAAEAGVALFSVGESFGTLSSQSTTTFSAQGQSSPAFSSASASITQFNLAIGGTGANTPTATAISGIAPDENNDPLLVGDRAYLYQINRSGSGRGYAWAFSGTFATVVASEFPF